MYCDCGKITENPDTGLCASCSRAQRKPKKEAKRKPIKKVSEKGLKNRAQLTNAYKVVQSIRPAHCGNCGAKETTFSHILPRGQYPKHAANPVNIFLDCLACHQIWEHGTLVEVERLRDFSARLKVIKKLEPEYFFRRFKIVING